MNLAAGWLIPRKPPITLVAIEKARAAQANWELQHGALTLGPPEMMVDPRECQRLAGQDAPATGQKQSGVRAPTPHAQPSSDCLRLRQA